MLSLKVEGGIGEDVRDIIIEMTLVAARTGCMIVSDVNGVHLMIKPGADPRVAYQQWEEELASKRPYKITCAHPIEIPRDKPFDSPASTVGTTHER